MAKTSRPKLTPKQDRFVREYLVDLNATQAAIRAGYSKKNASEIGYGLLQKISVSEAVEKAKKKRSERTEITADRILKEYARIAFLDPRRFFNEAGNLLDVPDLDEDTAACIAGIDIIKRTSRGGDNPEIEETKKIRIADKLKALNDCGRHIGLFENDNKQKSQGIVVINEIPPKPDDSGT